jgi:hypothetical protein
MSNPDSTTPANKNNIGQVVDTARSISYWEGSAATQEVVERHKLELIEQVRNITPEDYKTTLDALKVLDNSTSREVVVEGRANGKKDSEPNLEPRRTIELSQGGTVDVSLEAQNSGQVEILKVQSSVDALREAYDARKIEDMILQGKGGKAPSPDLVQAIRQDIGAATLAMADFAHMGGLAMVKEAQANSDVSANKDPQANKGAHYTHDDYFYAAQALGLAIKAQEVPVGPGDVKPEQTPTASKASANEHAQVTAKVRTK